jgi:hypothetical protein
MDGGNQPPGPFRQPTREAAASAARRRRRAVGTQTRRRWAGGSEQRAASSAQRAERASCTGLASPAAYPDVPGRVNKRVLSTVLSRLHRPAERPRRPRQAAPRESRYRTTLERNQAISAPAQWEIRQSSGNAAPPSAAVRISCRRVHGHWPGQWDLHRCSLGADANIPRVRMR